MKTCHRFHIEDVEPGDRLVLQEDYQDTEPFEVTVLYTLHTSKFGWVVYDTNSIAHYIEDYWNVGRAA